jgi:hypothetical protein
VVLRSITAVSANTRIAIGTVLAAMPSAGFSATRDCPSFALSATPRESNSTRAGRALPANLTCLVRRVYLIRRFPILCLFIQRIAGLPTLVHHLTVERMLVTAASTPLEAAISLVSAVSRFLAGLHTRNSRCV